MEPARLRLVCGGTKEALRAVALGHTVQTLVLEAERILQAPVAALTVKRTGTVRLAVIVHIRTSDRPVLLAGHCLE